MKAIHNWNAWIGTDEAGKGDYFGPLVVAAVYVDRDCREIFSDLGITDGKTLSNRRIRDLAELMHDQYERHIVVVERMPTEYNSLYTNLRRRGQNLNHLLASLHAEAIHTLATRIGAKHALVDRFSKDDLITQQLHQRVNGEPRLQHLTPRAPFGMKIKQVPKAERDIAVAAASIIARDTFLSGMETLSEKYEIQLPRGAYQVVEAGREFISLHGSDALGDVAKLHFSLTDAVRALETTNLF
ncbi:MAG: ribonuclease HIII [Candidatus Poribacteria bacterium]|nr:ribonuclease HIII [Candidatus Poribacteria bacterium]